jgi:ribosomal protein L37AE/L43A
MFARILPFLAGFAARGGSLVGAPAADLPSPLPSFDARDWAKSFVAHVKAIPGIPADEETMLGWFANALMRGFDENDARWRKAVAQSGRTHVGFLTREAVAGAVLGALDDHGAIVSYNLSERIIDSVIALAPNVREACPRCGTLDSTRISEPGGTWHCYKCFLVDKNGMLAVQNDRLRDENQRLQRYQDAVEGALV